MRVQSAAHALLQALTESLEHEMPPNPYQAFYAWALSPANPHQELWITTIGVPQFAQLTTALLDGLLTDAEWEALLPATAHMNLYLLYETVSDNLAIDAAPWASDHQNPLRREALRQFNRVMIQKLQGHPSPTASLLEGCQDALFHLSTLSHSLSEAKQRQVIDAYLQQEAQEARAAIEYGAWGVLVANIDACVKMLQAREEAGSVLLPLLRESLMRRYAGVSCLLEAEETLSLEQLAEIGTDTILVMAVVAYYSDVLAQVKGYQPALQALYDEDAAFPLLLEDAALLIRLLNDLGTYLLTDAASRHSTMQQLRQWQAQQPFYDLFELLAFAAPQLPALTRIHKDVRHGEFNVALHHLAATDSVEDALDQLEDSLDFFARLYSERYSRLRQSMHQVSAALGDSAPSELAYRFVKFHEALYTNLYSTVEGEYAV